MKFHKWLIINRRGSARLTSGLPQLDRDEIAMQLQMNVPDTLFQRFWPVIRADLPDSTETQDIRAIVDITAEAVSEALQLSVSEVRDGLQAIIERNEEIPEALLPGAERCQGCNALVVFLSHEVSGKIAPILATEPTGEFAGKGNIAVDIELGTYRIIKKDEEYAGPRYLNHYANCPNAHLFNPRGYTPRKGVMT